MIRIVQVADNQTIPNLINPDLVERVVFFNPEDAKALKAMGANAVLKMQSGDAIYIQETVEQVEEKIK
jgi:uncharacterized protein YlzI (FlbEa/FlbD family)